MRLTLRTLLAYLDDILEPSQTRELGEKINESGFAEQLISRIRDVMRRRRLSAPALTGPGSGIDPNAVGEYLDNTLSPEKIADVEKVCLESDVHLAEVAACHQILTLVLHEPVEVPADSRSRLYALTPDGGQTRPQVAESTAANLLADAPLLDRPSKVTGVKVLDTPPAEIAFKVPEQDLLTVSGQQAPPHDTVPEYLRESTGGRRWLPYAAVASIAIFWILLLFKDSAFRPANNSSSPATGSNTTDGPQVAVVQPADKVDGEAVPPEKDSKVPVAKLPSEGEPIPAKDKMGPIIESKEEKPPVKVATVPAVKLPLDSVGAGTTVVAQDPTKSTTPTIPTEPAKSKAPEEPAKKTPKVEVATVPAELPPAPPPTPPADPAPAVILKPAKAAYTSTEKEGVMLYRDQKRSAWLVMQRRSLLYPNDLLAVAEPFEGNIQIDDGAYDVSLRGGTLVRLLAPSTTVNFGFEIQRGRIVIHRDAETDATRSLLVKVRGALWRLDLLQPDTLCAIEAVPILPDRFEQDLGDHTQAAVLHVATGSVRISREGGGDPITVLDRTSRALTEDSFPEMLKSVPRWVGPFSPSSVILGQIRLFARQFEGDEKHAKEETAEVSMAAAADDSHFDRLATDCLGLIGAYEPLVTILQRTAYVEARKSAIEGLRVWLPQNIDNRKLLKQQLSKRFPPGDADIVYDLLWGYNADDLRNRVKSKMLIDWMATGDVALRELAFQNASRLTKKTFEYRSNGSAAARQDSIRRWEKWYLQNGNALLPAAPAPPPPPAAGNP